MSLKNYKSLNFETNQPVTAEDMNTLVANDTILFNKINALPRGVIGFDEGRVPGDPTIASQIVRTNPPATPLANDPPLDVSDPDDASFTFIQNRSRRPFRPLECSFELEDNRMIEISTFIGVARVPDATLTRQAVLRLAFFIRKDGENWRLLNSTWKSSRIFQGGELIGSICASYMTSLTAGRYFVRVGLKAHNVTSAGATIGPSGAGLVSAGNPLQLAVEDMGQFIGPRADVEYEF